MPPAIRISATLSSTYSLFPANGLNQRIGLCSCSPDIKPFIPNCQTAKITCPSRPGFTIDYPFSPASSRLNIPISIPLPPDPLSPASPLPSTLHGQIRTTPWRLSIHLTRFPMRARQCNAYAPRPRHAFIQTGANDEEKERHTGTYFIFPLSGHLSVSQETAHRSSIWQLSKPGRGIKTQQRNMQRVRVQPIWVTDSPSYLSSIHQNPCASRWQC